MVASWAVLGGVDTLGGAVGLSDWFLPVFISLSHWVLAIGAVLFSVAWLLLGYAVWSADGVPAGGTAEKPQGLTTPFPPKFRWRDRGVQPMV